MTYSIQLNQIEEFIETDYRGFLLDRNHDEKSVDYMIQNWNSFTRRNGLRLTLEQLQFAYDWYFTELKYVK